MFDNLRFRLIECANQVSYRDPGRTRGHILPVPTFPYYDSSGGAKDKLFSLAARTVMRLSEKAVDEVGGGLAV